MLSFVPNAVPARIRAVGTELVAPPAAIERRITSTSSCHHPPVTPETVARAVVEPSSSPPALQDVALDSSRRLIVKVGVVADAAPAWPYARIFSALERSPSLLKNVPGIVGMGYVPMRDASVVNVASAVPLEL